LLGLLGSDFDGERAAAARLAGRFVRQLGLSWDAIVIPSRLPAVCRIEPQQWRFQAQAILDSDDVTAWEQDFCSSLLRRWRGGYLPSKQQQTLDRIFEQRVNRAA
jgi:hypothetical protein